MTFSPAGDVGDQLGGFLHLQEPRLGFGHRVFFGDTPPRALPASGWAGAAATASCGPMTSGAVDTRLFPSPVAWPQAARLFSGRFSFDVVRVCTFAFDLSPVELVQKTLTKAHSQGLPALGLCGLRPRPGLRPFPVISRRVALARGCAPPTPAPASCAGASCPCGAFATPWLGLWLRWPRSLATLSVVAGPAALWARCCPAGPADPRRVQAREQSCGSGMDGQAHNPAGVSPCEAELQELMEQIDIMVSSKKLDWERKMRALETRLDLRDQELANAQTCLDQKGQEVRTGSRQLPRPGTASAHAPPSAAAREAPVAPAGPCWGVRAQPPSTHADRAEWGASDEGPCQERARGAGRGGREGVSARPPAAVRGGRAPEGGGPDTGGGCGTSERWRVVQTRPVDGHPRPGTVLSSEAENVLSLLVQVGLLRQKLDSLEKCNLAMTQNYEGQLQALKAQFSKLSSSFEKLRLHQMKQNKFRRKETPHFRDEMPFDPSALNQKLERGQRDGPGDRPGFQAGSRPPPTRRCRALQPRGSSCGFPCPGRPVAATASTALCAGTAMPAVLLPLPQRRSGRWACPCPPCLVSVPSPRPSRHRAGHSQPLQSPGEAPAVLAGPRLPPAHAIPPGAPLRPVSGPSSCHGCHRPVNALPGLPHNTQLHSFSSRVSLRLSSQEFRAKSREWDQQEILYQTHLVSVDAQQKVLSEKCDQFQKQTQSRQGQLNGKLRCIQASGPETPRLTWEPGPGCEAGERDSFIIEKLKAAVSEMALSRSKLQGENQKLLQELKVCQRQCQAWPALEGQGRAVRPRGRAVRPRPCSRTGCRQAAASGSARKPSRQAAPRPAKRGCVCPSPAPRLAPVTPGQSRRARRRRRQNLLGHVSPRHGTVKALAACRHGRARGPCPACPAARRPELLPGPPWRCSPGRPPGCPCRPARPHRARGPGLSVGPREMETETLARGVDGGVTGRAPGKRRSGSGGCGGAVSGSALQLLSAGPAGTPGSPSPSRFPAVAASGPPRDQPSALPLASSAALSRVSWSAAVRAARGDGTVESRSRCRRASRPRGEVSRHQEAAAGGASSAEAAVTRGASGRSQGPEQTGAGLRGCGRRRRTPGGRVLRCVPSAAAAAAPSVPGPVPPVREALGPQKRHGSEGPVSTPDRQSLSGRDEARRGSAVESEPSQGSRRSCRPLPARPCRSCHAPVTGQPFICRCPRLAGASATRLPGPGARRAAGTGPSGSPDRQLRREG
ncbi:Deuterosome assembly protein 1 [Galemys pyrenaicus]|uniref:Deuterosome assembly protein 1 n=1 Tax=Galemys pyrenaicus TaxID=202257 RepID=A0A8J6DWH4_GALPY|nr:Deuterosome assembly protein 1 [Galemys pyrenaicus]